MFTYIDYNRQIRASLNQNPVERKQIFLLFIALLELDECPVRRGGPAVVRDADGNALV